MARIAFKMKLFPGYEAEYKRRHDEIWPELVKLLKDAGVSDYSIFIEEEANVLFAILNVPDASWLDGLGAEPVMQKWWKYMSEISESHADGKPVITPLKEVFHLL